MGYSLGFLNGVKWISKGVGTLTLKEIVGDNFEKKNL